MRCDVIGHVTAFDQSDPSIQLTCSAPGGETALDQSERAPKSPHLSDNRGLYRGAPSGNKRTTNQKATFQISTNQNEPQNLLIFDVPKDTHTTFVFSFISIYFILDSCVIIIYAIVEDDPPVL